MNGATTMPQREPSMTEIFAALQEARVVDFVRFVGRSMREQPSYESMSFSDGWNILLGAYGERAAMVGRKVDDDAA